MPGPGSSIRTSARPSPASQDHLRFPAIAQGVVDQIPEETPQCHRPAGEAQGLGPLAGHRAPGVGIVGGEASQQGRQIDGGRPFVGRLVPGEGEGRVEHGPHLVEIGGGLLPLLPILDELRPQPQACQHGAEIVRDRGEQQRAVVHQAANARGHAIERSSGLSQLARPPLRQGRGARIQTQPVRGLGKVAQGAGHAVRTPHERHRHEQRGEPQPEEGAGARPAGSAHGELGPCARLELDRDQEARPSPGVGGASLIEARQERPRVQPPEMAGRGLVDALRHLPPGAPRAFRQQPDPQLPIREHRAQAFPLRGRRFLEHLHHRNHAHREGPGEVLLDALAPIVQVEQSPHQAEHGEAPEHQQAQTAGNPLRPQVRNPPDHGVSRTVPAKT